MKTSIFFFLATLFFFSCQQEQTAPSNIVTTDVTNFWEAFNKINSTTDTSLQFKYLDSLYLQKGSPGLEALIQVRDYTREEYIKIMTTMPKFWASIKENTLKSGQLSDELQAGIEKLRAIYPDLKPAKIYFSVGAFRTNGTTLDSMVLIGSELAMADNKTVTSEFPEDARSFRRTFFDSNPIENLVVLNVHEFVHTQQNPPVNNLLAQVVSEGVAEFVSVTAMNVPSVAPAIEFGKQNSTVRETFEKEMFYMNNRHEWLWSDAPNDFNVRDLGYYIGYSICELYYNAQEDKMGAIEKLIKIDYENEEEFGAFVDGTKFFSKSLDDLYSDFETRRPQCILVEPAINNQEEVDPSISKIKVTFSEPMDVRFRNFDYGPTGEETLVRIKNVIGWSEDGKSLSFEVQDLEPNKLYEITLSVGFRNLEGVPLKPKLISFKTKG